jgi:hypothetical protein
MKLTDHAGLHCTNVGRDVENMSHSRRVDQLVSNLLLRDDAAAVRSANTNRREVLGFDGLERILCKL